jgi:hypothetical protein
LALLTFKHILHTLKGVDHDVLDLFYNGLLPNVVTKFLLQVVLQLREGPHVALDFVLARYHTRVLGHTVVGQVGVPVVYIIKRKVTGWESDVGLCVHPHGEWIPICNEDPLPQVKLSVHDYEWVFNVLLHNPLEHVNGLVVLVGHQVLDLY